MTLFLLLSLSGGNYVVAKFAGFIINYLCQKSSGSEYCESLALFFSILMRGLFSGNCSIAKLYSGTSIITGLCKLAAFESRLHTDPFRL